MLQYIIPSQKVSTTHLGHLKLRDEASIFLLYVYVRIFCIKNFKFHFCSHLNFYLPTRDKIAMPYTSLDLAQNILRNRL